jgi:nicotinamidase-related amidase
MSHPNILDRDKTALVVVDFQEAFREAIPDYKGVSKNISIAIRGFEVLSLPIIITEQYPKGLGKTAKEILDILSSNTKIIEKTAFSSCGEVGFLQELKDADIKQVLLCGLETHICINQTAHDLLNTGYDVHILADAVDSRRKENKQIGINKMASSGAVISSIEMALFELMGDAKHKYFKEIQALVK